MASLFEGKMEIKGASKNWTKVYGVLMREKLDLYKDSTKGVLMHTVVFLPQTYYKEGKKKKEFSFSLITEKISKNHFKVDNKADREQWRDYINLALKPEAYGTSRILPSPGRKGGSQGFPHSMYSTEFQQTGQQGLYDDCATGRGVHFIDNRGNSPIDDSGIDSGGTQFSSCTSSVSDKGRSDDGVVTHLLPGNTSPFEKPRSAGNSPFTSPGSSATVTMLEKYQWFMGNISRDQADKILKKEPGSVFGLRYSKGHYVLSLRKLDSNGVLKQFHHRIILKDTQYFIDGITTFSADSILGLLECFVHHCPETPPLGGRLDALHQNPDEEDSAYDYDWEPEKTANIIQENLKLPSHKDDGDNVKLQEKLPAQDMSLMRALSKVAEWLLPEPKTCSVIACENGIVSDADSEVLSLASNVGEPAAYKLIHMWQARKLSMSRLREALLQHHHNAAAAELEPFCYDATSLLWSEKSTDSVPVKYSYSLALTVKKSDPKLTSNSVAVTGRTEDSFVRHALMSPLDAPQPPNSPSMSERSRSSERNSANLPIEQSQEDLNTNSQDDSIVIDPEDTTKLTTQDPTLALIEQNLLQTRSEEVLTQMCWIPFGIHTFNVLPQGGLFHLGTSSTISYGWGSAGYIQVPEDAFTTTSLDVHCALIVHGPFSLPDGYQFASPVVYLTFNTTNMTKPITLHLPHWCKNNPEDQTDDSIMFVMAPHSLGEGEKSYQFRPFEGGRFLIHDGVLSITGHNSLFAIAFKNSRKPLYHATHLSKHDEEEGHICNDVVFTYAHPIWQQIFENYHSDRSISRTELFSFNEDKVLKVVGFPKSGQGWEACVNGKSQVSRISYSANCISDEAELESAVVIGVYPPRISFEVLYARVTADKRRSKFVRLEISGSDEGSLEFLCGIYINHPPEMSNGFHNPPTNGVHEPHMPNGTETPDLRQFLQNWHRDFVSSVDARAIVLCLKGERLIPEPVSTRIEGALTVRDANSLLFEHLLCQGVPGNLARVFEVMKNEPGYDRMNKLGEEMGNKLRLSLPFTYYYDK